MSRPTAACFTCCLPARHYPGGLAGPREHACRRPSHIPCDLVDEAVEQADFITLHMPKTPETTHLINAERINKMKPGVRSFTIS